MSRKMVTKNIIFVLLYTYSEIFCKIWKLATSLNEFESKPKMNSITTTEKGWRQKKGKGRRFGLGGKNLLNSLPWYLFFLGRFWIIGWIATGWFERKGRIHHDKDFFKDQIRIRKNVDPDWQLCSSGVTYCSVQGSSFGYQKVRHLPSTVCLTV